MPSPRTELYFSDEAILDLKDLASHSESMPDLQRCLQKLGPDAAPSQRVIEVSNCLGVSNAEARRLIRTILRLQRTRDRYHQDNQGFVAMIVESLERQAETEEENDTLKLWKEKKDQLVAGFGALAADDPIMVAEKARQLSMTHERSFSEARIVTDVRPVFNAAGDKILKNVVVHSLLVEYHEGYEHRTIQIGLDKGDLEQLKYLCERALRKEEAAQLFSSAANA